MFVCVFLRKDAYMALIKVINHLLFSYFILLFV